MTYIYKIYEKNNKNLFLIYKVEETVKKMPDGYQSLKLYEKNTLIIENKTIYRKDYISLFTLLYKDDQYTYGNIKEFHNIIFLNCVTDYNTKEEYTLLNNKLVTYKFRE